MNFQKIQDQIISILQGVEGIGIVFPYKKRIQRMEDFAEQFAKQKGKRGAKLNAWIVSFASASNVYTDAPLTGMFRDYEFVINGYIGLDDTSESEIRQIAERILDAFAENRTLGTSPNPEPPFVQNSVASIVAFGIAELAPVLCSTVEIRITCRTLQTGLKFK